MRLRVATAALGAAWEADFVEACRQPHSRAEVVQRCYDLADLLAAATAGTAQVAFVADGLRWLDREAVADLARAGTAVVAVTTAGDRQSAQRLRRLGVSYVASADDGSDHLLMLAEAAAAATGTRVPRDPERRDPVPRDPVATGSVAEPAEGRGGPGGPFPTRATADTEPDDQADPRSGPDAGWLRGTDPSLSNAAGVGWQSDPDPGRWAAGVGEPGGAGQRRDGSDLKVGHGAGTQRPSDPDPGADEPRQPGQHGRVFVIWGPKGAPGRTTVAVNLAVEAARLGIDTLLVDADTYGGSVAQLLGLLDDCPGLAWAARLATRGELDAVRLRRDIRLTARHGPSVLVGLPRPELWTELRPAVWDHLVGTFRQAFPLTVLDVGFCLEEDEELLYDQVRFRRNGVACQSVQQADTVIAVTRADPLGLHDFIKAFRSLQEVGVAQDRIRVVVNQVRDGLFGGDVTEQVRAALAGYLGAEPAAFIPYDRRAVDAATRAARALAEACPASPARRALAGLTGSLLGIPTTTTARRRGRRRAAATRIPDLIAPTAVADR